MVDKDVILEKVGQIQRCLKRIHLKTKDAPETLDNIDIQDIFVLNLQRAVQATIDLAAHVIADEGLGLPNDLRDNFSLLEKAHIIDDSLSQRMQKMVGFRNVAVHEYSNIDVAILKSVLQGDLKDIEEFYAKVLQHFKFAP